VVGSVERCYVEADRLLCKCGRFVAKGREEELPVYQKLGAIRERAVTMGKIADILAARGQLDEALRIRREEELPVYQKLGANPRNLCAAQAQSIQQTADIEPSR
jgi:hypothetical protein